MSTMYTHCLDRERGGERRESPTRLKPWLTCGMPRSWKIAVLSNRKGSQTILLGTNTLLVIERARDRNCAEVEKFQ